METMYDRLGDLLSQTLSDGFVKIVKKEDIAPQSPEPDTAGKRSEEKFYEVPEDKILRNGCAAGAYGKPGREGAFNSAAGKAEKSAKSGESGNSMGQESKPKQGQATVIHAANGEILDPAVAAACRLLGVTPDVTEEELKSAYRQKLMYYHPDKHGQNEIMKKVATNKTMQVIDAYNLLMERFKK